MRTRKRLVTVLAVVAALAASPVIASAEPAPMPAQEVSLTRALDLLSKGTVASADMRAGARGATLTLTMPGGGRMSTEVVSDLANRRVMDAAVAGRVDLTESTAPRAPAATADTSGPGFDLALWAQSWGPLILAAALIVIFIIMLRYMGGARFTQKVKAAESATKFDDVAGIDEIRDEVLEIADYLKNPDRYREIGATLPKGIVLYGPPGTGKTLLAKAVAGEAGVPFFSASGAEFIEVYVGVGAKRIRHLFEAARKAAPALLYIDEIDAIGERRSGGPGEREHTGTLDQLLTEMDGFDVDPSKPVVVLASTNRLEHLDPALLRAGRFDRKIAVGLPDRQARERILGVHTRRRPLAPGVELAQVAAYTAGMAGADLASLCNEASFEATRHDRRQIDLSDFRRALMRIAAGPEKRTQVLSEAERRLVAYHEMGHAIVGHMLPNCEPVERVTVIPQGQALGVTFSLPDEDNFLATRREHLDRLARVLGGRAAEELVFGEMTSGAADDLNKATSLARMMVENLGMARPTTEESLSIGLTGGAHGNHGQARVEGEIQEILAGAYRAAFELLEEHLELLHTSAEALLEAEALDREHLDEILGPRPARERFVPLPRSTPASDAQAPETSRETPAEPFGRFGAGMRRAQESELGDGWYTAEGSDLPAETVEGDRRATDAEHR